MREFSLFLEFSTDSECWKKSIKLECSIRIYQTKFAAMKTVFSVVTLSKYQASKSAFRSCVIPTETKRLSEKFN